MKRFLLFIALALPAYADQVAVNNFAGGLNNNNNPSTIEPNTAQDLLNVDITPGGLSVKKRDGYGVYKALGTGQAMHGGFSGYDSAGNTVQIWGSSTSVYGIVADGTPTQLVSSMTLNSTIDCANSQSNFYCTSSSRNFLLRTDGTTKSWFTTVLGTMVESTPDRIVVAGVSGSPNTLYVSQSNTFTNFTTGVGDTDAFTEVIASQGSKLTHIRWGCAKLLWWKDQSFGYLDFDNQYTAQVKTVSNTIGTFDNTSAVDPGGNVWFRGQDGHTWRYDCSALVKESVDITPNVQTSGNRTANLWTQTTQSDFASGAVSFNGPSVALSTAITAGSVIPSSFSFVDTDSTTFSLGSFNNSIDTTTVTTSISLNKYVVSPFTSLSGWTTTSGAFTTAGGTLETTSAAGIKRTVEPNPVGDWIFQYEINMDGACNLNLSEFYVGVLDSSGQGHGVKVSNGAGNYRFLVQRYSGWSEPGGGSASIQTSNVDKTCDSSWHTVQITHEKLTGGTSLYFDGAFQIVLSSAGPTSYSTIKLYAATLLGSGVRNLYLTAREGNFTSRVGDTAFAFPVYGTLNVSSGSVGSYAFAVRASSNSANAFTSDSVITNGAAITNGYNKRYLVYSASMTHTNGTTVTTTPSITEVSFVASSTGTYYSAVRNAPSLTAWSTFGAGVTLNDGTETFYMRSSTSAFTVLSSTPSWTAQTNGGLITIATGTYFQIRDDFILTVGTQTPILNDFTVNWYEGNATDQAYIHYFDNAIWQSVVFGAGQSTNNYIFKKDLINDAWTLYNFGANGMLFQSNVLYFGDTAAGNIFNYGSTTSDNGTAINAYWKSKEFSGADPYLQTQLTNIDTIVKKDQGSTLTATYTVETSTATSYSISLSSTTQTIINNRKSLPSGKMGYTFSMKYGDQSASSDWELLGFRIGFTQQPYRPSN